MPHGESGAPAPDNGNTDYGDGGSGSEMGATRSYIVESLDEAITDQRHREEVAVNLKKLLIVIRALVLRLTPEDAEKAWSDSERWRAYGRLLSDVINEYC